MSATYSKLPSNMSVKYPHWEAWRAEPLIKYTNAMALRLFWPHEACVSWLSETLTTSPYCLLKGKLVQNLMTWRQQGGNSHRTHNVLSHANQGCGSGCDWIISGLIRIRVVYRGSYPDLVFLNGWIWIGIFSRGLDPDPSQLHPDLQPCVLHADSWHLVLDPDLGRDSTWVEDLITTFRWTRNFPNKA